jgi:large subunit ribosomal protein L35
MGNTLKSKNKKAKIKLKTKSLCKKKFKITGTGKVKIKNAGKRHGMSKRSNRQIRVNRKADTMNESDAKFVKKIFMPNG